MKKKILWESIKKWYEAFCILHYTQWCSIKGSYYCLSLSNLNLLNYMTMGLSLSSMVLMFSLFKNNCFSLVQWFALCNPSIKSLRQEDCEFEVSLDYSGPGIYYRSTETGPQSLGTLNSFFCTLYWEILLNIMICSMLDEVILMSPFH